MTIFHMSNIITTIRQWSSIIMMRITKTIRHEQSTLKYSRLEFSVH